MVFVIVLVCSVASVGVSVVKINKNYSYIKNISNSVFDLKLHI